MLCVFDFDGTLADSKAIFYKTVEKYSHLNGFTVPSRTDMHLVFGNPNPPIVFEGWGDKAGFLGHLTRIYEMTDDVICDNPADMPLFEGIREALDALDQDNLILSIVTSRSLKPIQALIDHHQIDAYFKTIRSNQDILDKGYRGKPHPDKLNCVLREINCPPDECIMIGDTLMDMAMAKSAKTQAIGVAWGYHDEETLRSHGADEVALIPASIQPLTQQILLKNQRKE